MYTGKLLLIILTFTTFTSIVLAQEVTNIKTQVEGRDIIITYDLIGESPDAICEVVFYYGDDQSQNNLLEDATGDLGKNITVGSGKSIRIKNLKPFMPYMKNLTFRGNAQYTFIPISDLTSLSGAKRTVKSNISLSWKGGIKASPLNLQLMKENIVVDEVKQIENQNKYSYELPKLASKGVNYKLVLIDADGNEISTGTFTVKPKPTKVLLTVGLVSAAVLGGVAYFIFAGDDTPAGVEPEGSSLPSLPAGANPGGG